MTILNKVNRVIVMYTQFSWRVILKLTVSQELFVSNTNCSLNYIYGTFPSGKPCLHHEFLRTKLPKELTSLKGRSLQLQVRISFYLKAFQFDKAFQQQNISSAHHRDNINAYLLRHYHTLPATCALCR